MRQPISKVWNNKSFQWMKNGDATFQRQEQFANIGAMNLRRKEIGYRGALLLAGCVLNGLSLGAAEPGPGWPAFRGPWGNGRTQSADAPQLPLNWGETNNVRWKTLIPYEGGSTPVVMDGQVWVSSATKEGNDFYAFCVDAETGRMLFEKHLFHSDTPEPLGNSVNCYASPSPAIESGRVYFHFGSYGTACLDTATAEVVWKRDDLPCRHYRGPGSSVILYKDLLIVTLDGVDQQYLTALNKYTGETVWRTERNIEWDDLDENGLPKRDGDARKSFATPLVIQVGGKDQLVSLASSAMFAYDPRTGRENWKVRHSGHSSSVSPVFSRGLVLATTGSRTVELWAIRPDGTGDVTDTHVAWRFEDKDVPTIPSPIVKDELVFLVSNKGAVTCLETGTGETVWRERIGGDYLASPVSDGDRIYFFSVKGKTQVIRAGRSFELLAENQLESGFMASPAAAGKALYLRTRTHLYRIEED
jgi:outer membrane protein assembly factor BamB